MPCYDYKCPRCANITEVRHAMSCTDDQLCYYCKVPMEKQLSSTFYISSGMGPTTEDRKQTEHTKKVKDYDRAIRMRKKAFGKDSVGDPNDRPDPKHIVKRGRTLGGRQMEVDKGEVVRALAKDPLAVKKAQEALKKTKK